MLAAGVLVLLACWGIVLKRWQRGISMLLAYLPFAGAVTLMLSPSTLPLLFKDFFFLIPAYLAFFWTRQSHLSQARVPGSVLLLMLALAALVLVQSFNPGISNWLVAAIGAKVWLFYLPLLFLAFAMLESADDLIRLFRLMLVVAWIPCVLGIIEFVASMIFGYEATMTAIYGAAAAGATQGFVSFDVGGALYRIPSTFTFVTQYFGYTLAMMVPAYAAMGLDPSRKWRRFAGITLWLTILAAFLSGARAAYVFVPLLLMLTYLLDGKLSGAAKIVVALPLVLFAALSIAGIDPFKLFDLMLDLMQMYSSDIAEKGLIDAVTAAPFGMGTGMNTGPARYAFDDPNSFIGIENYYAKAQYELGIVGLLLVAAIFFILLMHGFKIRGRIRDSGLKSAASAILAFIVTIALNSFKGWQIDLDPINVYFWVFSGFMLKLGHLDRLRGAQEIRPPAESNYLPQPSVDAA